MSFDLPEPPYAREWTDEEREEFFGSQQCDWCGKPFEKDDERVAGYDGLPTHRGCQREARRAWRHDRGIEQEGIQEREPFTDWPNGQGTYD